MFALIGLFSNLSQRNLCTKHPPFPAFLRRATPSPSPSVIEMRRKSNPPGFVSVTTHRHQLRNPSNAGDCAVQLFICRPPSYTEVVTPWEVVMGGDDILSPGYFHEKFLIGIRQGDTALLPKGFAPKFRFQVYMSQREEAEVE